MQNPTSWELLLNIFSWRVILTHSNAILSLDEFSLYISSMDLPASTINMMASLLDMKVVR